MSTPAEGYIDCYYSRTLAQDTRYPVLEETLEAEVCVIGGGMAGLATALGLAERGKNVVLLEARRIGWGASGRNGGFCGPGYSIGLDEITDKVGREQALALYRLTKDAQALIRKRIKDFAIDCDPVDGIVIASCFDNPEPMEKKAEITREELGREARFLPREELREMYRSPRYYDGVLLGDSLHFHSLNFTRGIAAAAAKAGVRIFEESPVTELRTLDEPKRVMTPKGAVRADQLVLAMSGYIGMTHPAAAAATLQIKTFVLLTEPVGERLREAITVPYACADDRFATDYYRPLKDGRLLWGGRIGISAPRNLKQEMLGDLAWAYPQLEGVSGEVAWEGTMGYATHKMPQIGEIEPGVWTCQGFGGHGMNATTAGGEVVAKAIAGESDDYKLFEPFGWPYAGGPLGPVVAQSFYWWMQFKDWLARPRRWSVD